MLATQPSPLSALFALCCGCNVTFPLTGSYVSTIDLDVAFMHFCPKQMYSDPTNKNYVLLIWKQSVYCETGLPLVKSRLGW